MPTELKGTTLFVTQGGLGRSVPTDRNNVAPRVGFAWSMDTRTVVRGGAGVYYGLSPATNYQYPGTAYSTTDPILFSTDNYQTQFATLANPFPLGIAQPQGQKYGALALWGYDNANNLGTEEARNADIYQWNLGVQHLFPWDITIGIDYSANRSTHLPWGGYTSTRNRNFISSDTLAQVSAQQHALDPTCDIDSCVSNYLNNPVANPFQPFFTGPTALFNEPASAYTLDTVPLLNLLRPYPQFNGTFQGLPNFGANSWYNSMQIRFQKRANHYISFEGNYTVSKATDDSSIGFNAFVGNLNLGNPQQLDRLKVRVGHQRQRCPATICACRDRRYPCGPWPVDWSRHESRRGCRGRRLDRSPQSSRCKVANHCRSVWPFRASPMATSAQTWSATKSPAASAITGAANATGNSLFNAACFADPGDQMPGNAPRYFSDLRGDGIHNTDLSFTKEFNIKEHMQLQFRGEFFNFTNTPRFAISGSVVRQRHFWRRDFHRSGKHAATHAIWIALPVLRSRLSQCIVANS